MQTAITRNDKPSLLPCDHYAGSRKFLKKALGLRKTLGNLFDITLDLEDGAKATNRLSIAEELLEEIITTGDKSEKFGIRLPFLNDPLFSSIAVLFAKELGSRIRSITIPKLRNSKEFECAKDILQKALQSFELALPPLHILIENSEILTDLSDIGSDPVVETLEIGIMDFISSLQGSISISECDDLKEFSNTTLNYMKSAVVCAAGSCNITPVHNISREYTDLKKLAEFCTRARQTGFSRMWSIHPSQIPVIIQAFTPSAAEIKEAYTILLLAKENDWGPVPVEKKLHDLASFRYYAHLLNRAKSFGIKIPADAQGLVHQIKSY